MKSKLEKHINSQLRAAARIFETELHHRTASRRFTTLAEGCASSIRPKVNCIDKAIANAQAFEAEVVDMLEEVRHAEVA